MTRPATAHSIRPGPGTDEAAVPWSAGTLPGAADWNWRPEVALPLLILAAVYVIGWWRLARQGPRAVATWRLAVGIGGIALIVVALLSPLERAADMLFAAHMVQHLLLIMVAAPALLLAQPLPAILWALARPLRGRAGRLLRQGAPVRRGLTALTAMPVAWSVHVGVVWLWHLPAAYDAAVSNRVLHDLEHLTFFGSALMFWWPLVNPPPRLRPPAPHGLRVVYLVLAAFQSALLGLLLILSPRPLYASYAETAPVWGLTRVEDQALGGVMMWGLGGAIDMLAILIVVERYLTSQDRGGRVSPAPVSPAPAEDRDRRA